MNTLLSSTARWASGLVVGSLFALSASAAVLPSPLPTALITQPYTAGGEAFLSGTSATTGTQQLAEDFRFATGASVTAFRWWGTDIDLAKLKVFLVADVNGDQAAQDTKTELSGQLTRGGSAATLDGANNDIYQFDFSLTSPLAAAANSSYYLMVWADDLPWNWLESTEDPNGVSYFRDAAGLQWNVESPNLSLVVFGDANAEVPEPSALALSALALAAAAAVGRRRRVR